MTESARNTIGLQCLNGTWTIALDPDNQGRQDAWFDGHAAAERREIPVPGAMQVAFPRQHGVAWYWKSFVPSCPVEPGERALLRFHAVEYYAEVWLNGQPLGSHEGGETPFVLDATEALAPGENLLTVRVLNPIKTPIDGIVLEQTPHRNKYMDDDFRVGAGKNYGGIVQSVEFLVVPAVRVDDVFARPDLASGAIELTITLRNESGADAEATLRIAVGPSLAGTVVVSSSLQVDAPAGASVHSATLRVPHHRPWSLEDPFLYRITVETEAGDGQDATRQHLYSLRCGFRDFRVVDGFFQLNGKRLWLRSTHTGNHYPLGYYEPVDPDLLRRDLVFAKAIGLNMVRFISGMALPEQLDACDELGLLVYEENLSAWLLGDSEQMGARFDRSLREMILRDRNHASMAIWGLLNETHDGAVFRHAVGALALLRELDDTRTVLLSSGRWDADLAIGSVSNPRSTAWEPVWGKEGTTPTDLASSHKEPAYFPGVGDVHIYPQFPHSEATNTFLRTIGHDSKPVFVSEYGFGSLLDVIHITGRYQQTTPAPAADDIVVYQTMRDSLEADWARYGMDSAYPFPRDLLRESQRLHSRQRLAGLNTLRANAAIAGYNVTGMLDHGYTGEGIWTLWREWKPGVVDAFEDGFAPLRWCLFVEPLHGYTGRTVTVEVVLANEDVLPPGQYPARLRIFGPNGTAWEQRVDVRLPGPAAGQYAPLAVPVLKAEVRLEGPAGTYTLAANLDRGGSPAGDRLAFHLSDPAALPAVSGSVTLWGVDERSAAWLRGRGIECRAFGADAPGVPELILVGDLSGVSTTAEDWRGLAERVARGSTAIFLAPAAFARGEDMAGWLPLATKGSCARFNNWLYHREDVAKPHPFFAGLPAPGILDYDYYGPLIPTIVFEGQDQPDYVVVAFFATGYAPHPARTGYVAGLITAAYRFGAGKFTINSLRILENIDRHPAADRLLLNMIDHSTRHLPAEPAPLPTDFDQQLAPIGYR